MPSGKGQLIEVDYKEILDTIEGRVERLTVGSGIDRYLRVDIKNSQSNSPVRVIKFWDTSVSLRYGDYIQAYYLKAEKVVTKSGFMGAPLEYYFIQRNSKKEEKAIQINILNNRQVVATYGSLPSGKVRVHKKA